MQKDKRLSYLMFITSALIFGTIGIFRRYIPISSAALACCRGGMGALFLTLFVVLKGGRLRHGIGRKKVLLLLLTGGIMGINWLLLFEAYNYTSVATATLCYYMQPTIVILLSPIFFRERLTARKLLCALCAAGGMVLVSGILEGGSGGAGDARGILLGLSAAVFYAAVIILNKKVSVPDAYEKTILQLLAAAIVMIPYLLLGGGGSLALPETRGLIMLLLVGLVHTGLAYALYFGSMPALPAQSIAVLSYIDPVAALILSALILKEGLSLPALIGAVLIIGSALVSELSPKKTE